MKLRVALVVMCFLNFLPPVAQAAPGYIFPIDGCKSTYSQAHHDYPASDILTKKGCRFVAPTSGVIDEVSAADKYSWKNNSGALRGGLSISMIGDDGVLGSNQLSYRPLFTLYPFFSYGLTGGV